MKPALGDPYFEAFLGSSNNLDFVPAHQPRAIILELQIGEVIKSPFFFNGLKLQVLGGAASGQKGNTHNFKGLALPDFLLESKVNRRRQRREIHQVTRKSLVNLALEAAKG